MHLSEEAQLLEKQHIVLSTLEHLAGLQRDTFEVLEAIKSSEAFGYRRRAVLHPIEGTLGFFERNTHSRIPVERCIALTEPLADFPGRLPALLGTSTLKELAEVRLLECEGRVSLSLHFKAQLRERHRNVIQSILRSGLIDGGVLVPGEGKGQVELIGSPVLEEEGVLHRPDGFAQANAQVNRRLVQQAVDCLDVHSSDSVLELYAGNGNFTFRLAPLAAQIVAVESSGLSVSLAQQAALARRVSNVRFMQGDSEKAAMGMVREAKRFDRLLVDPPRSGAPGIAQWASGLLVERVVYVACDPSSLARDAKGLVAAGYAPLALQVFDLFPQTHHVEAVMTFSRQKQN